MEYRSTLAPLGIPLIHVMTGTLDAGGYHRGIAKGWIAVGDIAVGILFAAGGMAVGTGLSLGGLSLGLLCVGGCAAGGFAVGGCAIGIVAVGGLAVAWSVAAGGLAIAGDIAVGGLALARHANDGAAADFFAHAGWSERVRAAMPYSRWLIVLLAFVVAVAFLRRHAESR